MRALNTSCRITGSANVQEEKKGQDTTGDGREVKSKKNFPKKDLSNIQCYTCFEYGHYATKCPHNSHNHKSAPVTAAAHPAPDNGDSDDEEQAYPVPSRCCIYEDDSPEDEAPLMAATKKGKQRETVQPSSSKTPEVLQRSRGVQKSKPPKPYNPPSPVVDLHIVCLHSFQRVAIASSVATLAFQTLTLTLLVITILIASTNPSELYCHQELLCFALLCLFHHRSCPSASFFDIVQVQVPVPCTRCFSGATSQVSITTPVV